VLVVLGLAAGGGGERSGGTESRAEAPAASVTRVADRVERLRDLRFRRVPVERSVSPTLAAREGLADFDRSYPLARRRADEELLELLGALPPGADLRREIGTLFRDQVGGYYDPRTKRLAVVTGPTGRGTLGEIVLAHELNHALEDQRFGLEDKGRDQPAIDDGALANTALVEGTATVVMVDYARAFLDPGSALADLVPAALAQSGTERLPRYLEDSLLFPYDAGQAFVERLRVTLDGWGLVDYALRRRRPVSTEQVLHPAKYLADERPLRVRLPGPDALGVGWSLRAAGTLGEFDTRELLRLGRADGADRAAAGWGGGRYALWRREGRGGRCASPCRARDALLLRWRWDTPRDAREAAAALPAYVAGALHGRRIWAGRFALRGGGAALAIHGAATALGFAPTAARAARLAGDAVRTAQ
jgi:hypothetical protein